MSKLKVGDPIWIPNPYPSAEPLDKDYVAIGPGLIDEDPKGTYRKAWCPTERSERPVYVPAVLSNIEDDGYVCSTVLDPSIQVKLPLSSTLDRRDVGNGDGYDDCLNVKYRNPAELLWNVQKRYTRDKIYTMCGSNIVISVNPYKAVIPGSSSGGSTPWRNLVSELVKADRTTQIKRVDIFDPAVQRVYCTRSNADLPPHIYSVASKAVDNVLRRRIKSQVIILSGIPGSGKSTNCKAIMDYVVTATSTAGSRRIQSSDYTTNDFDMTGLRRQERQILAMHAVLDSFGSCSTSRNSNSSRLGKVIRVYFPATSTEDSSGKEIYMNQIATTQIELAMLDRGRLASFPMSIGQERNFHIFYQLLAGYPILNSLRAEDFAKFL